MQNREWESTDHFNGAQKSKTASKLVVVLIVMIFIYVLVLILKGVNYLAGYKRAEFLLLSSAGLENALEKNMSSGEAAASALSKYLYAERVEDNKIISTDGMTYTFECSDDTKCIVTVDVNGDKGPNALTKNAVWLNDRIIYEITENQNGFCDVIVPKWLSEIDKFVTR